MDEDCVAGNVDVAAGHGIRTDRRADVSTAGFSAGAVIGATVSSTDFSRAGLRTVDVRTAPAGAATIVPSTIVFATERRSFEGHAAGIAPCRITRLESDAARDRCAARVTAPGTGSSGAIDH